MAEPKQDYYEVLGANRSDSQSAIRKAYREKAALYHPDNNDAPEAGAKYKELYEAYEVLSDKKSRTAYDQHGHDWKLIAESEKSGTRGDVSHDVERWPEPKAPPRTDREGWPDPKPRPRAELKQLPWKHRIFNSVVALAIAILVMFLTSDTGWAAVYGFITFFVLATVLNMYLTHRYNQDPANWEGPLGR